MARWTSFVVLASLVLALALAADEPVTYDLRPHDRWQPGDTRTKEGTSQERRTIDVTDATGASLQHEDIDATTTYAYVEKVVEADDTGRPTRSVAVVRTWSRKDARQPDEPADTCIQGARVEVAGAGRDRSYRIVTEGVTPTAAATSWLQRTFGSGGADMEAVERALLPASPVAVGATWEGDGAELVRALGDRLPLDGAKAKSTGRLLRVEGGKAVVAIEVSLPFRGFPGRPGAPPLPWTEGGTLTMTSEVALPLEGRVRGRTASTKTSLSGKATSGGPVVAVTNASSETYVFTPSGELPEAPAPR